MTFSSKQLFLASTAVPAPSLTSDTGGRPLRAVAFGGSASFLTRRQRASDRGGNTLAAATVIGAPGKSRIVNTVSRSDADFFRVSVSVPFNVRLNLKNRSNAAIVGSLLDSQGQVLSLGGTPQTTAVAPDRRLNTFYSSIQPGTYFVRLTTRSRSAAQYELKLNIVDPAAPASDCGCGS